MDLLGDLGGITEILCFMLGIFLFPISEFSFIMSAAKKMFFVRTKDETLFKKPLENESKIKKNNEP